MTRVYNNLAFKLVVKREGWSRFVLINIQLYCKEHFNTIVYTVSNSG